MKKTSIILLAICLAACKKDRPCLPCYYMDHLARIDASGDSVYTLSQPPTLTPYTVCFDTTTNMPFGPNNFPLGFLAQLNSDIIYVSPTPPSGTPNPGANRKTVLYCR